MTIKKTLIHFSHIELSLSADELKAALIAKYGDAAVEVLGDETTLQSASYSAYSPDEGVKFTFVHPREGHNS